MLEASLLLPIFISFVLVLNCFIQLAAAQTALQSAVSETTKQIAVHMYPVQRIIEKAEMQMYGNSSIELIQHTIEQIDQLHDHLINSEDYVEKYADYIPEPILLLLQWEKKKRELIEENGQNDWQHILDNTYKPGINKAFTTLLRENADSNWMQMNHLSVIEVQLPNLISNSDAKIAIEAQYELKMAIPFFQRAILLRKRAVERAWTGS